MQSIIGFFNTLGDFFETFGDTITRGVDSLLSVISILPPMCTSMFLAVIGVLIIYALLGR